MLEHGTDETSADISPDLVAMWMRVDDDGDDPFPEEMLHAWQHPQRAVYRVRLVLEAPLERVAEKLEAALLRGETGMLDDGEHQRLLGRPPVCAPEWLEELGGRAVQFVPASGSQLLYADLHASAYQTGLRPLQAGDEVTELSMAVKGWHGFDVNTQQHFLHADPEVARRWRERYNEPQSMVAAREESAGDEGGRSFVGLARHVVLGKSMMYARYRGRVQSPAKPAHDSCVAFRYTVTARRAAGGGRAQTELVRELLGGSPICSAGPDKSSLVNRMLVDQFESADPVELQLKHIVYMMEVEARAWVEAHGFGLVEVWRGLEQHEGALLSMARIISKLHCCTPGEGAPAVCERSAGPSFDLGYAKELAYKFKRKAASGPMHGQFVEGSVSIRGFAYVLDRICRRAAPEEDIFRRFVDLGAGIGNAVIAAHALFPFRACTGVELVPDYVKRSHDRAAKYMESDNFYRSKGARTDAEDILVQGDFLNEVDWSDASVVFCNAVTWPTQIIDQVATLALRLRPHAVFMLLGFNKFFPSQEVLSAFEFRSDACLVSWLPEPQGLWVYRRL